MLGRITSIVPNEGSVLGGTRVTITTTDLGADIVSVTFNRVPATLADGSSRAVLNLAHAISPRSIVHGLVDVVVRALNNSTATTRNGFFYKIECRNPGSPGDGYKIGTDYTEGARVRYSCRYGFQLVGEAEAVCEYERDKSGNIIATGGKFVPDLPNCEPISCPDPGTPQYGSRIAPNNTTFVFEDKIVFYCLVGYTRVGPSEIFCQGNGVFSAEAPTCRSNYASLTLVRFRTVILSQFADETTAFASADIDPTDGLISLAEFKAQAVELGLVADEAASVFGQMQWRPDSEPTEDRLKPAHYRVLRPIIALSEGRVLLASKFQTAERMFLDADRDSNLAVSRDEFEAQGTGVIKLSKVNAALIWQSVVHLGQQEMSRSHFLLLMGQADIATFRGLVTERFDLVIEAWDASNPNNDAIITKQEFEAWLLRDYGIDDQAAALIWKDIDSLSRGFVDYKRFAALGLGRLGGVSLLGFRGLIQSMYTSRSEAVSTMDLNRNGVVTKAEFRTFAQNLGMSAQNVVDLLANLCSLPERDEMQKRELDAITYDVDLGALRVLLRSEYMSSTDLELAANGNKDAKITSAEWASLLMQHHVDGGNAVRLFSELDVASQGYITAGALRLFRGRLAICDFRLLVEAEFHRGASHDSRFAASLWKADINGDQKVTLAEFQRQAQALCIDGTEAARFHEQLDVRGEGFVDLVALSAPRMPFLTQRNGSLTAFRMCLQSYFDGDAERIVQDLVDRNSGFPATLQGLVHQGAQVAWETPSDMERLFLHADPLGSGLLSRPRYQQLFASDATLVALRVVLVAVAPGGAEELLPRVDLDNNGQLSSQEFAAMCQLLGFSTANAKELFARLNAPLSKELSVQLLQPVTGGSLSFNQLRLLARGEFLPPDGAVLALEAADADRSQDIDFPEFRGFMGAELAVTEVRGLRTVFGALDIGGDGLLRPGQLDLLFATSFDFPALRHLTSILLGGGQPAPTAVDTSGDGLIDMTEFILWAHEALSVNNESSVNVFKSLDICNHGELAPLNLALLHRNPDIAVLRAVLSSRYGSNWRVFAEGDLDKDGVMSESELMELSVVLMLSPSQTLPLFRALDHDHSGSLSASEMHAVTENNMLLVDFRRLASLALPSASAGFELADLNGNGLITAAELDLLACNRLALKRGPTVDALFQVFDRYGLGALPLPSFEVFTGNVDLWGYRKLVQSMWSTPSDSFLLFDADFDGCVSLDEAYSQAAFLAISESNMQALLAQMANRSLNQSCVDWDIYSVVVEGLAGFRTLVRKTFTDPRKALLDVDVARNWNEITPTEFHVWGSLRFHLPDFVISDLFAVLDSHRQGVLTSRHIKYLMDATVNHRMFYQIIESALGNGQTAFDKADSDKDARLSFEEMRRLATTLGVGLANSAELFHGLDAEETGFLTKEQFTVMAPPNHAFRLTNLRAEDQRFHVYELELYADEACTDRLVCDLPVASGHYVDFNTSAGAGAQHAAQDNFGPAAAFDGSMQTRWVAACEPCGAGSAGIGCNFDRGLEVRCIKLFQSPTVHNATGDTASRAPERRLGPSAKVAAGFRMQTWTGKAWKLLVDVPKPPLWEIDNDGAPLTFKTTIPDKMIHAPEKFMQKDERAAIDFAKDVGMNRTELVILGAALAITGLLIFCICCPILLSPWCLQRLRRNAPERMEGRRAKHLEQQLESAKIIQTLEQAMREKAVVIDEWGIKKRGVKTPEQQALARQLEKERKRQLRLEADATANRRLRLEREEARKAMRAAHLERLRRMREAYQSKTIAIDGIAVRAPHAILLELGFEPEMIEAFGLPGFEGIDEGAAEGAHDEEAQSENESKPTEDEQVVQEPEVDSVTFDPVEEGGDDDPLQIPPRLDEIMGNVKKEGARFRKRRGGMAGMAEGTGMSRESLEKVSQLAKAMQATDLQADDEVERWIQIAALKRSDPKSESLPIGDFNKLEVDHETLKREKAIIRSKFDAKRRATLLANEDVEVSVVDMRDPEVASETSGDDLGWKDHEMQVFGKPPYQGSPEGQTQDGQVALEDRQPSPSRPAEKHQLKSRGKVNPTRPIGHTEKQTPGHAGSDEKQNPSGPAEEHPIAYGGNVYRGMPVRPRGTGTPRRLQLASEVYRSSLLAPQVREGQGLQWGKFAQQRSLINPKCAEKPMDPGESGESADLDSSTAKRGKSSQKPRR